MTFFKIPKIQQVSLDEFDRNRFDQPVARVDRCQTCHLAINRAGFEKEANPFKTHPRREVLLADNAHSPDRFGCTGCHEGQGVAVNSVKQAHGEVHLWEFPLLRGSKVQSSCTSCHLDVQKFAEDAPLLAEGQRLFEQVGCTGCHLVKGYENIPKIAPSLKKISAKVDPGWMVRWIENPHKFRPRTRMPNFELKQDDAVAMAAYIWSQSKEEGDKWTAGASGAGGISRGRCQRQSPRAKNSWRPSAARVATALPTANSPRPWANRKIWFPISRISRPKSLAPSGSTIGSRIRAAFSLTRVCRACACPTTRRWRSPTI